MVLCSAALFCPSQKGKLRWSVSHCDAFYFWKFESFNDDLNINNPLAPLSPDSSPSMCSLPGRGMFLSFRILATQVESWLLCFPDHSRTFAARGGNGFSLWLLFLFQSFLDQPWGRAGALCLPHWMEACWLIKCGSEVLGFLGVVSRIIGLTADSRHGC